MSRRLIADAMRRESVQPEPAPIVDEFARGIAKALERRRLVKVPGLQSREDVAQAKQRARVAEVLSALAPPAPTEPEVPEPPRQSLRDEVRTLVNPTAAALPLNGAALLAHVVSNLGPGASSAHNGSSGA